MSNSFKFENDKFLDTKGIVHNKKKLSDILYPIGSIYISVNSTSPATLFGGSWTQIKDKFLYPTNTSKTTGGSTTTGSTTLTVDQIPAHNHKVTKDYGLFYHSSSTSQWQLTGNSNGGVNRNSTTSDNTGGGKGHTHSQNLPPYFTVFAWYRTA